MSSLRSLHRISHCLCGLGREMEAGLGFEALHCLGLVRAAVVNEQVQVQLGRDRAVEKVPGSMWANCGSLLMLRSQGLRSATGQIFPACHGFTSASTDRRSQAYLHSLC